MKMEVIFPIFLEFCLQVGGLEADVSGFLGKATGFPGWVTRWKLLEGSLGLNVIAEAGGLHRQGL